MISRKSESREKNSAEWRFWLTLRRASQLLLLALFSLLFLYSRYPIEGSFTVDIFFKIDPLVALLASLAARDWIGDLAWSLPVLGLAYFLGRFFCGWVCPLGATIDISRRYLRKRKVFPNDMPSLLVMRSVDLYISIILKDRRKARNTISNTSTTSDIHTPSRFPLSRRTTTVATVASSATRPITGWQTRTTSPPSRRL